jgi:uncharacterized protein (DUF427 family)
MALKLSDQMFGSLNELRYQPVLKRVRVLSGDTVVADTTKAVLVWEPRRVVPSYAVPVVDVEVALGSVEKEPDAVERPVDLMGGGPPVLDPRTPFAVHTTPGEQRSVHFDTTLIEAAAFQAADPALEGHVILEFEAFDWLEEDEPIVSHPRDPYHRIDIRKSSRPIRIEHDGVLLAYTTSARFLFEGVFPFARYYMPREDVGVELVRSDHRTSCAYKGHATHWSVPGEGALEAIAWSYEEPLEDAEAVRGLIAFYTERLDVIVDRVRQERGRTPWSQRD